FCDICCGVTYTPADSYRHFYTQASTSAAPADVMLAADKVRLLEYLQEKSHDHTIFGWSTQTFDFPLLFRETGLDLARTLAAEHIDLQFSALDAGGTLLPLANVARRYGLSYNASLTKQFPALWLDGGVVGKR